MAGRWVTIALWAGFCGTGLLGQTVDERFACEAELAYNQNTPANANENEHLGHFMDSGGDWNGDGVDDVIIGGFSDEKNLRKAWIYLGDPVAPLETPCVVISDIPTGSWGASVTFIGDVDGGGHDDIAIGAPGYELPSGDAVGAVYVFLAENHTASGACLTVTPSDADLIIEGEVISYYDEAEEEYVDQFPAFGFSVAAAGDVDGYGTEPFPDLIVGAPGPQPMSQEYYEGRAYVILGDQIMASIPTNPPGPSGPPTITASNAAAVVMEGDSPNDRFGYSVAGVGDVDGDGLDEVAVGAIQGIRTRSLTFATTGSGYARVFDFPSHVGIDLPCAECNTPAESRDIVFLFGASVAGGIDINDDDLSEVFVGAPEYDPGAGGAAIGAVYAYSVPLGVPANAYGPNSQPVTWTPGQPNSELEGDDRFGWSLKVSGGHNADSVPDLVVGAMTYCAGNPQNVAGCTELQGGFRVGRVLVLSGAGGFPPQVLARYTGEPGGDEGRTRLGTSIAVGDINGDGKADVVAGASGLTPESGQTSFSEAGRAYVFFQQAQP